MNLTAANELDFRKLKSDVVRVNNNIYLHKLYPGEKSYETLSMFCSDTKLTGFSARNKPQQGI